MLCSMVIKNISIYLCTFSPSFRRVRFSSDVFAQSYRLSKSVTNMNPGHVKGVHDVNEVVSLWLMNFLFRETICSQIIVPKKQWIACTYVFIVCSHPYALPDHTM